MRYTQVAGQRVSAMSLGTVQLGMNYGIANEEGKPDKARSFAILKAALDAGVTALDTARAYGDSEEVLGDFFKLNPELREKVFITTKLTSGLPTGSQAVDIEKALVQSVETSLSALGINKINCLLLHSAADMRIHGGIVPDTLRRLEAQGLADITGVSVYHPEEAELLLKDDVYKAVQLPMNVFDQRFIRSGVLERLHRRGVYVFARSVFFQGLLFLNPEHITDPDLIRCAVPHLETLRQLSEKAGMSIAQFAVTFLRDMPEITSLVLGADNPAHIRENTALFNVNPMDMNLRHLTREVFKDVDYTGIMSVLSRPKK